MSHAMTAAERKTLQRKRDKERDHNTLLEAIPEDVRDLLVEVGVLPREDRDNALVAQAALLMMAAERIEQRLSPDYHPALPPTFVGRLNYAEVFVDGVYQSDEAVERALPSVLNKVLDYGLSRLRQDIRAGRVRKFRA